MRAGGEGQTFTVAPEELLPWAGRVGRWALCGAGREGPKSIKPLPGQPARGEGCLSPLSSCAPRGLISTRLSLPLCGSLVSAPPGCSGVLASSIVGVPGHRSCASPLGSWEISFQPDPGGRGGFPLAEQGGVGVGRQMGRNQAQPVPRTEPRQQGRLVHPMDGGRWGGHRLRARLCAGWIQRRGSLPLSTLIV